jgi:hypothetical protein
MVNTIDLTTPQTTGSNAGYMLNRQEQLWEGAPARVRRRAFTVQNSPDWGGLTPGTGDIVKTQVIDQGVFVIMAFLNVLTAGSASSTVVVGDSTSNSQYLNNVSTAATGTFISAATAWKWYMAAADTLLVTLGVTAAATGAVLDVGYVGISIMPNAAPVTE